MEGREEGGRKGGVEGGRKGGVEGGRSGGREGMEGGRDGEGLHNEVHAHTLIPHKDHNYTTL